MVLLYLVACSQRGECPTFQETLVTNPDGAAPGEVIDAALASLAEFADWSGREGVCVSEIRLESEVVTSEGEDVCGLYHPEGWIEFEYACSVTSGVRHELCHALDHQDGWASVGRPDLFGNDRPQEDFAYLCDDGPLDLTLALGLDASCEGDHSGALRFVDDAAYPNADVVTAPPSGTIAMSIERRIVTGLPDRWESGPVVADGAIWGVGGDDSDPAPLLVRVDPATATASTVVLPEGVKRPVLGAAEEGRLLLLSVGAPYGAWELDSGEEAWRARPFPELDEVQGAIAIGEDVWLTGKRPEDAEDVMLRVDAAGAVEERVLPAEVRRLDRDADSLLASAYDDASRFWLRYDTTADTWTREENPDGWRPLSRRTLPGGLELVTWEAYVVQRYDIAGLGVRDLASGGFWTADAPCDEDLIGLGSELLLLDGDPWVWELPSGWVDGEYVGEYALSRIDVGVP